MSNLINIVLIGVNWCFLLFYRAHLLGFIVLSQGVGRLTCWDWQGGLDAKPDRRSSLEFYQSVPVAESAEPKNDPFVLVRRQMAKDIVASQFTFFSIMIFHIKHIHGRSMAV